MPNSASWPNIKENRARNLYPDGSTTRMGASSTTTRVAQDKRSRDLRRRNPRIWMYVARGWTSAGAVVHGGVSSATIAA